MSSLPRIYGHEGQLQRSSVRSIYSSFYGMILVYDAGLGFFLSPGGRAERASY